jgi:hypothetical protein
MCIGLQRLLPLCPCSFTRVCVCNLVWAGSTPSTPVTAASLAEQFYTRVGTYAVANGCTIDVVG